MTENYIGSKSTWCKNRVESGVRGINYNVTDKLWPNSSAAPHQALLCLYGK